MHFVKKNIDHCNIFPSSYFIRKAIQMELNEQQSENSESEEDDAEDMESYAKKLMLSEIAYS